MFCSLNRFFRPIICRQEFDFLTSKTKYNFNGFGKTCQSIFYLYELQNDGVTIFISTLKTTTKIGVKRNCRTFNRNFDGGAFLRLLSG
jgi:hypothetical protein